MYLCRLSLAMHSTISGHYFCDDYHFFKLFSYFCIFCWNILVLIFRKYNLIFFAKQGKLYTVSVVIVSDHWFVFQISGVVSLKAVSDVSWMSRGIFPNNCNSLFNLASIEYRKSNRCGSEYRIVSTCTINCDRLTRSQEHLCGAI